jgi:3-deoxy-D-arabino-heptulosonate 7-phosphate (DAHP) synthase
MVEAHSDPDRSLTDAAQAISLAQLQELSQKMMGLSLAMRSVSLAS